MLAKATGGKPVNAAAQPFLKAEVLEEIVSRRLVLAYARRSGTAASAAELDSALAELQAKLKSQHRSLDDFLRAQSVTQDDLRRQLAWNVVWEKYLARYVTAERLAGYFQAHRRELDGSRVSVSQILLRPAAGAGPGAVESPVKTGRRNPRDRWLRARFPSPTRPRNTRPGPARSRADGSARSPGTAPWTRPFRGPPSPWKSAR